MKNDILFPILILLSPFIVLGQKHDYVWSFGSLPNGNPISGEFRFDFNTFPPKILEAPQQHLEFNLVTAGYCKEDGELLFYTNGIGIEGANGALLENGDSLNPGIQLNQYYQIGARCINCAFFIPSPWDSAQVLLMHIGSDYHGANGIDHDIIYYTLIDKTANGGQGKVLQKNILVTDGMFSPFGATRHANGRDWWVVFQEQAGKTFHKLLIDNTGVHVQGTQVFPEIIPVDHPQNDNPYIFSADGNKLAFCSKFTGVHIFDFDRCTGELSNLIYVPITVAFTDIGYGTPLAFSPNNRFLYYATTKELRQLDLWTTDVAQSEDTISVYDVSPDPVFGLYTCFSFMQLGPDGQIYISSNLYFHTIKYPNKKGVAAEVVQRAIKPPYFSVTVPYFPNYRLGPVDGSPCDTLGLDNLPLAGFRCETDTLQPLQVVFTDNSFYEPATWSWDFGDMATSQDTSPVHVFSAVGVYDVCLTVANVNGEDTFCKEVFVGVTGVKELSDEDGGFMVYPNPASTMLTLQYPPSGNSRRMEIFNTIGKLVLQTAIKDGTSKQQVDLHALNNGIYLVRITENGKAVYTERVSVIR